jgi:mRNA-capping enzyme
MCRACARLLVRLQIVECSFDTERRVWLYMRDRPDKLTANHHSVFEKVMTSITDNITVRSGQC